MCFVGPNNECSHDDNSEMEVNQNDNSDDKQHVYPMKLQNSGVLQSWMENQVNFQKTYSAN